MKTNELMIGDIVLAHFTDEDENPTHKEPVRICAIDENGTLGLDGNWHIMFESMTHNEDWWDENVSEFCGIPLTEEIMENNHFNRTSCMFGSRGFTYLGKEVSWDGDNLIIQDLTCRTLLFVKVDYVHQVQHALRMFDMSNLADEFVV